MLINTVVLFIRDTLPVFLLLSLLLSTKLVSLKYSVVLLSIALVGAALFYANLAVISEYLQGAGVELIKISLLLLAWGALLVAVWFRNRGAIRTASVGLMAVALILPNALHFLIYSVAYWPTLPDTTEMLLGIVLGLGIASSLACVIYLVLMLHADDRIGYFLLWLFCAGQIAPITTLLEQVNYLSSQDWAWDTRHWVEDNSEYGHLLNALFGYEATPSYSYIVFYVIVLISPWVARQLSFNLHKMPSVGQRQS